MALLSNLDLQSNEIKYVSKELFMLPNLRWLNLADNHITKLPFDTIPKEFDSLVLYGNPIPDEEKARIMKHNPKAYFIMW
jgi:Leucine-rich repeat (LRR) protein